MRSYFHPLRKEEEGKQSRIHIRWTSISMSAVLHLAFFWVLIVTLSPIEFSVLQVRNVFIAPEPPLLMPDAAAAAAGPVIHEDWAPNTAAMDSLMQGESAVSFSPGLPVRIQPSRRLQWTPNEIPSAVMEEELYMQPDVSGSEKNRGRLPDFNKYLYVDYGRWNPAGTGIVKSGSRGGRHGGIESQSEGRQIDLTEWADKAAALILGRIPASLNWVQSENIRIEAELNVDKQGGIESLHILNAELPPGLEDVFRKAVQESSPLPQLPLDYPGKRVTVRLVFSIQ